MIRRLRFCFYVSFVCVYYYYYLILVVINCVKVHIPMKTWLDLTYYLSDLYTKRYSNCFCLRAFFSFSLLRSLSDFRCVVDTRVLLIIYLLSWRDWFDWFFSKSTSTCNLLFFDFRCCRALPVLPPSVSPDFSHRKLSTVVA